MFCALNLPCATLRYGQQVSAVDYSMPTQVKVTTTERAVFIARYVISTLPLGVMQRNTVAWTPALPADKLKAMYMLNMGSLDRITLVFDKNWWDPKKVACWVNRLTSDNGNNLFTEFYSLTNILNRPVLVAFNAGDLAPAVRYFIVIGAVLFLSHTGYCPIIHIASYACILKSCTAFQSLPLRLFPKLIFLTHTYAFVIN